MNKTVYYIAEWLGIKKQIPPAPSGNNDILRVEFPILKANSRWERGGKKKKHQRLTVVCFCFFLSATASTKFLLTMVHHAPRQGLWNPSHFSLFSWLCIFNSRGDWKVLIYASSFFLFPFTRERKSSIAQSADWCVIGWRSCAFFQVHSARSKGHHPTDDREWF